MFKRIPIVFVISLFLFCMPVYGADVNATISINAKTGDGIFDAVLSNMNVEAKEYLPGFIANLSVTYGVPKIKIENLIYNVRIAPADVYMIVGTAHIINQPVETVLSHYTSNKKKGWGVIAKELGIKPGSKEFQALKNGGGSQLEKIKEKKKEKGGEKKQHDKPGKGKKHD